MPQFDLYSYSGQIFYTLLFFIIFYIIISKLLVPKLARVDKFRRKLSELTKNKKSKPTYYTDAISVVISHILKK